MMSASFFFFFLNFNFVGWVLTNRIWVWVWSFLGFDFRGRGTMTSFPLNDFVGTGFEHYSEEISEFKPNKPITINL